MKKSHIFSTSSPRHHQSLSLSSKVLQSSSGWSAVTCTSKVSALMLKVTWISGAAFIFVRVQIFNNSLHWFSWSTESSQQGADHWGGGGHQCDGTECVCVCVWERPRLTDQPSLIHHTSNSRGMSFLSRDLHGNDEKRLFSSSSFLQGRGEVTEHQHFRPVCCLFT